MTLDSTTLRGLRAALTAGDDLVLAWQGQTGALNQIRQEATRLIAAAQKVREDAGAAAQAEYEAVESKARSRRDAANSESGAAYSGVAETQNTKVGEATRALADADKALRELEAKIQAVYGVAVHLFPQAPAGTTIRVG